MFQNKATSVDEYLAALPADRRKTIEEVRKVIKRNMPKGYEEQMNFGAITYAIPLERFADTYNKQPLCYVALASGKNYCSLHLMPCYGDPTQAAKLKKGFKDAGKKLDMGKSCVRFKAIDDLPLETIAEIVAATPADRWIAIYQQSRTRTKKKPAAGSAGARRGAKTPRQAKRA